MVKCAHSYSISGWFWRYWWALLRHPPPTAYPSAEICDVVLIGPLPVPRAERRPPRISCLCDKPRHQDLNPGALPTARAPWEPGLGCVGQWLGFCFRIESIQVAGVALQLTPRGSLGRFLNLSVLRRFLNFCLFIFGCTELSSLCIGFL